MENGHETWNMEGHCWSGSLRTVAEQFAIHLMGVQEVSWEKRDTE